MSALGHKQSFRTRFAERQLSGGKRTFQTGQLGDNRHPLSVQILGSSGNHHRNNRYPTGSLYAYQAVCILENGDQ